MRIDSLLIDAHRLYIETLLADPEAADEVWEAWYRGELCDFVAVREWWMVTVNVRFAPETGH